jgi:hypothetical protein
VPRGLLYDLFFEDAELLKQERRNHNYGNSLRIVPASAIDDQSQSLLKLNLAMHASGPFLNVLNLSAIKRIDRDRSSTDPIFDNYTLELQVN